MLPSSSVADCRWMLALGFAVLLAGCSGTDAAPEPEGDSVACAVGGVTYFADDCTLEMVRAEGATNLVIHHPDGAFRRFIVLPSGGLIAADGAEPAQVTEQPESFAVTVGQDRYVVPRLLIVVDAQ